MICQGGSADPTKPLPLPLPADRSTMKVPDPPSPADKTTAHVSGRKSITRGTKESQKEEKNRK